LQVQGLTQADLARMCGISRQAVSLWFKADLEKGDGFIPIRTRSLWQLAKALNLSIDQLTKPLPLLDSDEFKKLEVSLLWDKLYPSGIAFLMALMQHQKPAMARLVQVLGLFQAAPIVGKRIWSEFDSYKRFIEPRQREAWESVWNLQKRLGLI